MKWPWRRLPTPSFRRIRAKITQRSGQLVGDDLAEAENGAAEPPAPGGLIAKLRSARDRLPYVPRAVRLVWTSARSSTVAWAVLLIFQGLLPAATVSLTRLLVDSISENLGVGGGWANVSRVLLLAAAVGALLLINQLMGSAARVIRASQADLVQDHVTDLIQRKSLDIDLSFYDTPEYYDHLHRARLEGGHRPVALVESIGSLVQHGITLVAMAGILAPYGIWLPFVLLAGASPSLFVSLRYNLRRYRWRMGATSSERRAWYYYWLAVAREAAAEIRLFGLGDYLRDLHRKVRTKLRTERLTLAREQAIAELAAGTLGLLAFGATMGWMLWRSLDGRNSLGDLALFYQVLSQGQSSMRALLGSLQEVYSNSLYLGHMFEFLELETRVTSPPNPRATPSPMRDCIRFRDVTFEYARGGRSVLQAFSLEVPVGQIAAIVGPNGAGKSTLVKLLCRLYDPKHGSVEIDGIDLRELEIGALRRQLTVLFQEPIRFNATVSDNVLLGNISLQTHLDEIERAVTAAGAEDIVARLPGGYETMLGTMFEGGVDLSMGEWQRIALARAFLRQAPIIVLDEPTSSMDSWAETDWLRRFRELAQGRTALIVTHRFTTAMHADIIHVVEEGRVVESGTHLELVARNGLYAESWAAQMRGGRGDLQSR